MRQRHPFFAIAVVALLAVAASAQAGEPFQREVSKAFDEAGIKRLKLDNLAGAVTIAGNQGGAIEIRATVFSGGKDGKSAREVSELLRIEFNRDGDRLEVKSAFPIGDYRNYRYDAEGRGWLSSSSTTVRYDGEKVKISSGRKGKGLPLWVDYEVRLPAGVECDLRNFVGKVSLDGVASDTRIKSASSDAKVRKHRGDLFIDTGSGDIVVRDIVGNLKLDTGSGDLEVFDLVGDFDADTGSGDVLLKNGRGAGLKADTGSGDVVLRSVDYPNLLVDTGSGDVRVSSPSAKVVRWEVDTGSGDVIFVFPAGNASFRLEADTGSGEVDCELATTDVKIRHGAIRALTVGAGEGHILVDTGSGDVSIRKGKKI